jgi:uncharacterized membrane protein
MEGFAIFLCLIMLIILFVIKSRVSSGFRSLEDRLDDIERKFVKLKDSKIAEPQKVAEPIKPVVETKPSVIIPEKEIPKTEIKEPEKFETAFPSIAWKKEKVEEMELEEEPVVHTHKEYVPPPPPKPNFFERNPDLEKFIGENLANKIGIGILVLGIGFFVKYAIDQNWIKPMGPYGRVFVGILCGGILLGIGHKMRKTFTAFSSVMAGGGIAVLYLTITIAFQQYQIFSQTAAFVIMIGITAFTVALSLGYNKIELAIVAILGGFGSPAMVSTGAGNYVVLFSYILVLNVGMLVLAYYKKWNLVNIICYVFTILLYGSWLATKFDGNNASEVRGHLFFSTAFYLVFFAMNMVNNLKERREFKAIEFSLLLSNTFLYYAAGMYILSFDLGFAYRGLFTVLLAIFNFAFAYSLYRNNKVDRNLVFLLIGLVLTFISLAAPIQLEGNYITIFWAAEGVLLLWLSQKSGIKLMKLASVAVNALMLISLIMDWEKLYFNYSEVSMNIIFNKGYITGLFSLASLASTIYLLRNEKEFAASQVRVYQIILTLVSVFGCYLFNLFELDYQLRAYEIPEPALNITIGVYHMLFILGLVMAERFLILPEKVRPFFAGWGVIAAVLYITAFFDSVMDSLSRYFYPDPDLGVTTTGFWMHYPLVGLLLVCCIFSIKAFRKLTEFNKRSFNVYSWFFVAFFVFLASVELDFVAAMAFFQPTDEYSVWDFLDDNHKIGWPILWGLGAFLIIFIGLKQKIRHLRIISLVLFLITLLKLFLVDIQDISEGGKIAAFISLGILLLIISFMYQRLKKILLADEAAAATNEKAQP